ncbi:hypothetical protein [Pseudomonas donghuensis]|uniref:hypothetical protein n=1 Tax=Pseudomonas donghuensis TaxID=1163398 RepID=UPI00215DF5C3|nr:hypothetical protein [Pseudomonas donghuensis]UVL22402.1 hypothetical protein LOY30_16200 [Pseudomonas donghuensis]
MPNVTFGPDGYIVRPIDMYTDGHGPNLRLRVDPGQTGFFKRRMWRISFEFTALGATPIVLKVVVPVNFIIHHQALSVDEGGCSLRAYRTGQGTEGGTFGTTVPLYSVNFMTEESAYTFQSVVTTGGTFTPGVNDIAVETTRVRAANATAQATTVSGSTFGERGLAGSTYYLQMSNLPGVSGTSAGVFSLIVEERP